MTWKPFRTPRPVVQVRLDSGEVVPGLALEWCVDRVSLKIRLGSGTFSRKDGHRVIQGGAHLDKTTIEPESLAELNAVIAGLGGDNQKSAHVLVVYNEMGSISVEGDGQIVSLIVPAGFSPRVVAQTLERIIAWAEGRARRSGKAAAAGRAAGRASVEKRKTTRAHRRTKP